MGLDKIVIELSDEQRLYLESLFERFRYDRSAFLFYENQIPEVACLLLEGEVILKKRKKNRHVCQTPVILGLCPLLKREEVRYGVEVVAGSRVCLIDQTQFFHYLKKDERFRKLIHALVGQDVREQLSLKVS